MPEIAQITRCLPLLIFIPAFSQRLSTRAETADKQNNLVSIRLVTALKATTSTHPQIRIQEHQQRLITSFKFGGHLAYLSFYDPAFGV